MTLLVDRPRPRPLPEPFDPAPATGPARVSRGVLVVVSFAIAMVVLVQRWGLITHDTRLDLLIEPEGFLSATWHIWDPTVDMGRIQNQAVGYLFPMGPFMLLGSLLDVPPWVVERAWIALLLIAAVWGTARLLDALEIGSVGARVVGALAYGLSPFFISRIGNISAITQGAAFMPWMLLPLVRGARSGSPRRAAAASGIAVLCMGGVNAVVVGAALVPGALWLLTRQRGPRRASLARWWAVAVVAATAWWAVPLAFQGRYGIDFLAFTETAETTTAFTPPFEVLRGLGDWLANTTFQGVPLMAGSIQATAGLVIAGAALVVAIGLYGLCRRGLPERTFLVITLLSGAAFVGAGYGGALGNPLGDQVVDLLDGPLGLLRNVYKFAPVVLLPVAVGVVSGVDGLVAVARRAVPWGGRAAAAGVTVLVLLGAWPLLGGDLLNQRGFEEEPSWWVEAKAFAEDAPGRSLILPGLPLSSSTWGYTAEEPFEWGTSAEWASRQIAPLGSPGATRVLDTVESVVAQGGSPELAAYLRRSGFSTVVVRNDGDWQASGAPSPREVTDAVRASGLALVAAYGPVLSAADGAGGAAAGLHPIEIYQVPGTEDLRPVSTVPIDRTAVVSGDAGTPLQLDATPLGDAPVVMAADLEPGDPRPPAWLVTDGNQRTFTGFGTNRDNRSYVLTADEPAPGGGDVTKGFLPTDRVEDQTVAVRTGVTAVTASSYGSWIVAVPEAGPQQAIDGDVATAWAAAGGLDAERQWIRLELGEPTHVDQVRVRLLDDGSWRPQVRALEVTTEAGSVVSAVEPGAAEQVVAAPAGTTSWVRIRFADVESAGATTGPGLSEVEVPGIEVDQRLAVPDQLGADHADPGTTPPSYLFTRSTAGPASLLRRDGESVLRRSWVAPQAAPMEATVQVSAVRGGALTEVAATSTAFQALASSTLGDLPGFSPRSLLDDDPQTIWVAGSPPAADDRRIPPDPRPAEAPDDHVAAAADLDPDPTLVLRWPTEATLARLQLGQVDRYSQPRSVRVVNQDGEVREADVAADGSVQFEPLSVRSMWISFPRVARQVVEGADGVSTERPVALSGLAVPDRPVQATRLDTPIEVPCGSGPRLQIDGDDVELSLDTSLESVLGMGPIAAEVCTGRATPLAAGPHRLDTVPSDDGLFVVRSVRLDPEPEGAPGAGRDPSGRELAVERWGAEDRAVRVGPGAESYLVVAENRNAGWKATLDGEELRAVTLDGWKQGFVVPAGEGGVVTMGYAPTDGYRLALIVGALLVGGLLAMALVPDRRPEPPPLGTGRLPIRMFLLLTLLAAVLVGGPLALLVVPILVVGCWHPRWLGRLAGGSFAVAAVLIATGPGGDVVGSTGWIPTLLTLVAFVAVATSVVAPAARPPSARPAGEVPTTDPSVDDPDLPGDPP